MLQRIRRISLWMLGLLLTFMVVYGLSLWLVPKIIVNKDHQPAQEVSIYLSSNGMHTDIVMPLTNELFDWQDYVSLSDTKAGTAKNYTYVAIGWGDQGFFLEMPTWDDLSFRLVYRAALGLSKTAMHATFLQDPEYGKEFVRIGLSRSEYLQICQAIAQTFVRESGRSVLIPTDATYGTNDAFYQAKGSYSLVRTCNSWTNKILRDAGLRTCYWTPFAWDLLEVQRANALANNAD